MEYGSKALSKVRTSLFCITHLRTKFELVINLKTANATGVGPRRQGDRVAQSAALRQLGDVHGDAPRLVAGAGAGLLLACVCAIVCLPSRSWMDWLPHMT